MADHEPSLIRDAGEDRFALTSSKCLASVRVRPNNLFKADGYAAA